MNCKKYLWLLAAAMVLLSGCGKEATQQTPADTPQFTVTELDPQQQFTEKDTQWEYDQDTAVQITLQGSTAKSDAKAVKVTDSTVTICGAGTYVLTGSLENGMVIVNAGKDEKVQLILQNASISSATSAALYVQQADKVFVTLEGENALNNGGSFVAFDDNNIDAAVFSKEDLTFNGSGKLTVRSPAGHGIVSKDDLVFAQGDYDIDAASHGAAGKDSLRVADSSFTIVSGKDGLHAENNDDAASGYVYIADGSFHITAQGDGISAAAALQIDGGDFTVKTGGGSSNAPAHSDDWMHFYTNTQTTDTASAKGIKAGGDLVIHQGTFRMDCSDDAIHTNASAVIDNGVFTISTGDDGFHADSDLAIQGGSITINNSYEGLEGMTIHIAGGEIVLTSSDDGLNAAGGNDQSGMGGRGNPFATTEGCGIYITSGKLQVNAQGDGIDSNGVLSVTGGETYVSGPTNGGNGALDYGGSASITGGTFIAVGAAQMAQSFTSAENQGVIMASAGATFGATDPITITDSNGEVIFSWQPEKTYSSIVVSCPGLQQGNTYTLTVGTATLEVTMTSLIVGGSGGMGGGGQMPGGRPGGGMQPPGGRPR